MDNCNNITYNASTYLVNHCINKCFANDDDDNNNINDKDYYNKATLVNNCFCKCINRIYEGTDLTNNSTNNIFIVFFAIIIFLLIFCVYGIMKAKIQHIYVNTNANTNANANQININTTNTRTDLEAHNINYYTIDNPDNSQTLPKYIDIESNFTLPPKYNYDNRAQGNEVLTNELM